MYFCGRLGLSVAFNGGVRRPVRVTQPLRLDQRQRLPGRRLPPRLPSRVNSNRIETQFAVAGVNVLASRFIMLVHCR